MFEVFKGVSVRSLAHMSSKLDTATVQNSYYKEMLTENGLSSLLDTQLRPGRHQALTRKRSNSVDSQQSQKVKRITIFLF